MSTDHPFSREATIKHSLRKILTDLGFASDGNGGLSKVGSTREDIRKLHLSLKGDPSPNLRLKLLKEWENLKWIFADGSEIDVSKISPCLISVTSKSAEERMFRIAGRCWGMKLSAGYGRRMRYLVWDSYHCKLIGLIGLSDPVFNLRVRDEWVGWDSTHRIKRLSSVMDAFVLGALPPYSMIMGGKLVASLLLSTEIGQDFRAKYGESTGIISGEKKLPNLSMITTLSAFGRSSIYNRMRIDKMRILDSVGFTEGWGHFHIDGDAFSLISGYLKEVDPEYFKSYAFGNGPNWRLRVIKRALKLCGLREGIMRHGVKREVFICSRYQNSSAYLKGVDSRVMMPLHRKLSSISEAAMNRWVIPRASRDNTYVAWKHEQLLNMLLSNIPRGTTAEQKFA